ETKNIYYSKVHNLSLLSLFPIIILVQEIVLLQQCFGDRPIYSSLRNQVHELRVIIFDLVVAYQIVPSMSFAHKLSMSFPKYGIDKVSIVSFIVYRQAPIFANSIQHFHCPFAIAQYCQSFCTQQRYILYPRSEEHTSELQSRENLVCRL